MITIITEKPNRSIDIKGYGVDSYTDKEGKKIYRVYGIVEPGCRGRLVSRDSEVIKDLYIDDNTIVIYRNEDKKLAIACKDMLDRHIAQGALAFSVEAFKQWLNNPQASIDERSVTEEPTKDKAVN